MSRLIDALRKGQGEASDLILNSLVEGQSDTPQPEPQAAPEPVAVALTVPPVEPAQFRQRSPDEVRCLQLRLSAMSPLLPFDSNQHRGASEQYRILRTKIVQHIRQPRMIVISSAGPGDGKSVTAINLAGALSLKAEANVLLMDGDFRRSSVAGLLGLPDTPGITEVLRGASSLEEGLIQIEQFPNLHVLPAGEHCKNPVELLDSAAWRSLCARLRESYKYIIVDSPPIAAVADYDLIQAACDAVIVVVRPDHTDRNLCFKALGSVPKDKLTGVVLNCVEHWFLDGAYHYGYSYHY